MVGLSALCGACLFLRADSKRPRCVFPFSPLHRFSRTAPATARRIASEPQSSGWQIGLAHSPLTTIFLSMVFPRTRWHILLGWTCPSLSSSTAAFDPAFLGSLCNVITVTNPFRDKLKSHPHRLCSLWTCSLTSQNNRIHYAVVLVAGPLWKLSGKDGRSIQYNIFDSCCSSL